MMAEPVMDNPLAPSPHAHFFKITQDLKDCMVELKQDFEDSGIPINDDSRTLHRFCAKFEYLLQAGLKARTGLLGGKKDYWNYFCDCVASNKSTNDGIRFVKTISDLKTNLGRGRAFLRFCLMHQRLADTVQQCACNTSVTSDWYHPKAMWHHPTMTSDLINALYDLSSIQFDLSPRGYDLDASWPSFARKQFGTVQHVHNWNPPSRSTSISSLSSTPNQENVPSPQPQLEVEAHKLKLDLTAANRHQQEVQQQLTTTKHEKLAAESKAELSKSEVLQLEQNLKESREKCRDLEVQCDKLSNELKLKEEAWQEKETDLKKRLEEAENCIAAFASPSAPANEHSTGGDNGEQPVQLEPASAMANAFQATEASLKLLASEKRNQALNIELKSVELQLKSKIRVDEQKTTLITLLDRKLESVETKKKRLLDCLENAVKAKEDQNSRLLEATKHMTELSEKLKVAEASKKDLETLNMETESVKKELEKMNQGLMKANVEYKEMLKSLEGKSSAIAKLAKEKVIQYSDENKKMKKELEDLKANPDSAAAAAAAGDATDAANNKYKTLAEELQKKLEEYEACHETKEQELVAALQGSEKLNQEIKDEMEKLRLQLQARDEGDGDSERLVQLARESTELREAGKGKDARIEELEKGKLELENIVQSYEANEKKMGENEAEWQQKLEEQMEEAIRLKSELSNLQTAVEKVTRSEVNDLEATEGQCKDEDTLKDTASYERMLSALAGQGHDTRRNLVALEESNSGLREQVQLQEHGNQQLQLELTKAGEENVDLKMHLSKAKDTTVDLESKVRDLDVKVKELKDTEHQCGVLEKEGSKLSEEATDLRMILEMKNQDISDLVQKLKQAGSDRDKASEYQDSAFMERDRLQDQLIDLQHQLSDLQSQLKVKEQVEERLQSRLKNGTEGYEKLNRNMLSLKEELENSNTRIDQLSEELQNKLTLTESLQQELEHTKHKKNEVDKHLREVQEAKEAGDLENKELISQLQEANSRLATEKDDLTQNVAETVEQLLELSTDVSRQNAVIDELQSKQVELQNEVKSLEETLQTNRMQVQTLEQQAETLNSSHESLEESNKKLTAELKSTDAKLGQTEEELRVLKENHCAVSLQLCDAKASLLKAETGKGEVEAELAEARCDLNNLRQSLSDLEHEKSVMSETLNKSSSETEQKVQELLTENSQLKHDSRKLQAELESELNKLKEDRVVLEDMISHLKQQTEQSSKDSEQLQTKMEEVQREAANLHDQLTATSLSNQSLEEEATSLKGELENANEVMLTKDTEYEKMKSNLEAESSHVNEELKKSKGEARKKEKIFVDEADGLQKEISALRFQLSSDKMIYEDAMRGYETQNVELASNTERMSQQETLIETLEVEMRQQRDQRDNERQKLRAEIQELREGLSLRDKEYDMLNEKLKRAQEVIDTQKADVLQFQRDMIDRRKEWEEERQEMLATGQQLNDDNGELKKKLIQLLREKDSLWQKSEKLEHMHKVRQSEKWMENSEVTQCLKCSVEFSFLQRKHHCRLCGRIFCHNCSNQWIQTAHSSKKERVCGECLMNSSQVEERSEGGSEVSSELENDLLESVQIPGLKSPKWGAPVLDFDSDDISDPEVTEVKQPIGSSAGLDQVSDSDTQVKTSTPDLQGPDVERAYLGRVSTPDEEKLQSMTDDKKLESASGARAGCAEEDDFDVITEEEIATSQHDLLPDPDVSSSAVLTTEQISHGEVQPDPELSIRPGKMYALPILIEQPGTTLCWQFTTQPKNIHFSVSYRESDKVALDQAESLIPSTRVNSHKQSITGELQARKPGLYTLFFDNTFSRFTSKKLQYSLDVRHPTQ